MTAPSSGFTLIEALVAMAVLAVAAGGFVLATEGYIDTVAALEARAAAGWAADNRLAEARIVGLNAASDASMPHGDWHTTVATNRSDDPDIAALTITATNGRVTSTLRGFVDAAPPAAVAVGSKQ